MFWHKWIIFHTSENLIRLSKVWTRLLHNHLSILNHLKGQPNGRQLLPSCVTDWASRTVCYHTSGFMSLGTLTWPRGTAMQSSRGFRMDTQTSGHVWPLPTHDMCGPSPSSGAESSSLPSTSSPSSRLQTSELPSRRADRASHRRRCPRLGCQSRSSPLGDLVASLLTLPATS